MVNKIRKISAYFTDTTEFFPDFTKSIITLPCIRLMQKGY